MPELSDPETSHPLEQLTAQHIQQIVSPVFPDASNIPDSFTGVPSDVRAALSMETLPPDDQFPKLVDDMSRFFSEILTARPGEILFPANYIDWDEETLRTFTRWRYQLRSSRVDENGWMPQLWVTQLELIQDAEGADYSERIDNKCRAELSAIVTTFKRLERHDPARAAEIVDGFTKKIAELMTIVLERRTLVLQMSNPKSKTVRPLLGICIETSMAGYRVMPIYVMRGIKEIVDKSRTMSIPGATTPTGWIDKESFEKSEIWLILQKILAINPKTRDQV